MIPFSRSPVTELRQEGSAVPLRPGTAKDAYPPETGILWVGGGELGERLPRQLSLRKVCHFLTCC